MTANNQTASPNRPQQTQPSAPQSGQPNPFMMLVAKKQQEQQMQQQQSNPFQQMQMNSFSQQSQSSNQFFQQPGFGNQQVGMQMPQTQQPSLFTQFKTESTQVNSATSQPFFTGIAQSVAVASPFANSAPQTLFGFNKNMSSAGSNMSFINSQPVVLQPQKNQNAQAASGGQFLSKMDANNNNSFYSNASELNQKDIDEFKENKFRIGHIPYDPPAREFC
jgi:nucleoporin-like protein 2